MFLLPTNIILHFLSLTMHSRFMFFEASLANLSSLLKNLDPGNFVAKFFDLSMKCLVMTTEKSSQSSSVLSILIIDDRLDRVVACRLDNTRPMHASDLRV